MEARSLGPDILQVSQPLGFSRFLFCKVETVSPTQTSGAHTGYLTQLGGGAVHFRKVKCEAKT